MAWQALVTAKRLRLWPSGTDQNAAAAYSQVDTVLFALPR